MARDADALKIEKWAATGNVATPESQGLVRAVGWPSSYSQPNGDLPKLEVLNQQFREYSALAVELNTRGLLEWDATVSYVHPAVVMGSDGRLYVSVYHSTGVDPVTDTANASWKLLAQQGPVGQAGPVGPTSGFTFEALDANGDVGTGSSQVAQGNHTHPLSVGDFAANTFVIPNAWGATNSTSWNTKNVTVSVGAGESVLVAAILHSVTLYSNAADYVDKITFSIVRDEATDVELGSTFWTSGYGDIVDYQLEFHDSPGAGTHTYKMRINLDVEYGTTGSYIIYNEFVATVFSFD